MPSTSAATTTEASNAEAEAASAAAAALTLEERVARAKQLLAERQALKAQDEEEVIFT